jgi:hypothetical protein
MVTEDDVPPSGGASIAAIWELAGEHTKTLVTPETLLHRVQFRFLRDAPPQPKGGAKKAERPSRRPSASGRSRRTPPRSRS